MRLLVDGGWEARKGLRGKWFGFLEADVYDRCDSNTFEEAQHCRGEPVKIPPRGGSVTVSNAKLKSELRLPVVTDGGGALRKCAAQSAYIAVRTVRPELRGARSSQLWFEEQLPGTLDPKDDPTSDDISRVVAIHGVVLEPAHNLERSPHRLIQHGDDVYLVRVSAESIQHFCVFDAATGAGASEP